VKNGIVEIKYRNSGEREELSFEDAINKIGC
jgi:hypothetical protein